MTSGRPGSQAERTALAWTRTALTAMLLAAITAKTGISDHSPLDLVATAVSVAAAVAIWLCGRRRGARGRVPAGRAAVATAAVAAVLAGATATTVLAVHATR